MARLRAIDPALRVSTFTARLFPPRAPCPLERGAAKSWAPGMRGLAGADCPTAAIVLGYAPCSQRGQLRRQRPRHAPSNRVTHNLSMRWHTQARADERVSLYRPRPTPPPTLGGRRDPPPPDDLAPGDAEPLFGNDAVGAWGGAVTNR